jgi:hypothetical protein
MDKIHYMEREKKRRKASHPNPNPTSGESGKLPCVRHPRLRLGNLSKVVMHWPHFKTIG